jgi:ribosomal protein S10
MVVELDIFDKNSPDAELCKLYWGFDDENEFLYSVKSIAEEYGISSSELLKTVQGNCIAYSLILNCVYCKEPYTYKNRSDYNSCLDVSKSYICQDCKNSLEENESNEKRELIQASIDKIDNGFVVSDLTIRQAVFLYALIRHSGNEDLTGLSEFNSKKPEPFSPNKDFDFKILKELYHQRLILVDPSSNLDYISITEDNSFQFYIDRVKWYLPIADKYNNLNQFISDLDNTITSMDYIDTSYDEVVELCKELGLEESISYLQHILNEHQLDFTPGEKTMLVLEKALENYSVAQIYNFIWYAGKNAAAYYMRSHISKKQAANSMVGIIERHIEKVEANNWDVKSYKRMFDMPQSQVSRVLFNLLLHTDDDGFNKKIMDLL